MLQPLTVAIRLVTVDVMATSKSPEAICRDAGVSRSTYQRWRRDPASVSPVARQALAAASGKPEMTTDQRLANIEKMMAKMRDDLAIVATIREERRAAEGGES